MRGCFAENRRVFFWKLSGEKVCDVLLEQTLERTCDAWEECKEKPADSGQCSAMGSPCCSSMVFACPDLVVTRQRTSCGILAAS